MPTRFVLASQATMSLAWPPSDVASDDEAAIARAGRGNHNKQHAKASSVSILNLSFSMYTDIDTYI